ncbi:carboxypeptidase-like regulatory domain-containing protein [Lacihabitans soyangensis]|uniref:Carboxypeptidase-like regulatory domain-containing protein n=1 Tax=Lacihabitans soyangensis TaxID=869394 RepID=A0AAE3KVE5_9BACT|nr:carboxypeptidase-like regulatory domain-containing protein [Lacihabitans soyangensis]MCP9764106.1 hypothetical protein [Lacihabitans soyangensis]
MKICIFFHFLLSFSLCKFSFAQKNIVGIVFDSNSRPIPNVSIHIVNSTVGTQSSISGFYKIDIPRNLREREILFSCVGYERKKIALDSYKGDSINVFLKISNDTISEVNKKERRSFLVKSRLKKIENVLTGDNFYSKKCKVVNLNDFILLDSGGHKFYYYASKPIVILNKALGYKIEFEVGKSFIDGNRTTYNNTNIKFSPLIPQNSKEEKFWENNRKRVFYSSTRGFFYSIARNINSDYYSTYIISNFDWSFPKNFKSEVISGNFTEIFPWLNKNGSVGKDVFEMKVNSGKELLVFYNKSFGMEQYFEGSNNVFEILEFRNGILKFDNFGNVLSAYSTKPGKNEMFSSMLPKDYLPKNVDVEIKK